MSRVVRGHRGGARIVEGALLIALPVLFHLAIPLRIVIAEPYSYLGGMPMLIGLGLSSWAAGLFRQAGTGLQLQGGGSVLVTSGPYRFSRNPMYLGMLIWLVGLAVLVGSVSAFVFPIVFFLLANFLVIPLEERSLAQAWGQQFADYKRAVRRWL